MIEPTHGTSSKDMLMLRDNSEYCTQALRAWKSNLTAPLVLDICILDPESKRYLLIERWKILYKRKDENKDSRLTSINRRIVTLMRTLYCFVRLLPGFQLLQLSTSTPILNFRIYNADQAHQSTVKSFHFDTTTYEFPRTQTFRGAICFGVRYVNASSLQVRKSKPHHFYFYFILTCTLRLSLSYTSCPIQSMILK
jgi:hypothetical protein